MTAARWVAALRRRAALVYAGAALAFAAAIALCVVRLPLLADFANLLPPDAPAVRDLHRIEARVTGQDSVLVLVESTRPEERAAAATALAADLARIDRTLVSRVDTDDAEARAFFSAHRFLYVPLADLEAARDALAKRIAHDKLAANPLYIDLDDDSAADAAAARQRLTELRDRRRTAEAALARSSYLSADGATQLLQVRTAFAKTDAGAARRLYDALAAARTRIAASHPDVAIGFAGGPIVTLAEHDALLRGMLWSSIVTAVLVGAVLLLYLRSLRLLAILGGVLVVATTIAFGLAALTVGHLNAATAFLGAIIAGNGVNYGILLVARYREERAAHEPDAAMARAVAGTVPPTLVASLGAAIAYGSLAATSFQGFADFAIIGSAGMLVCWLATYALVPPLVLQFARAAAPARPPLVGVVLARLLAFRRPKRVLAIAGVLAAAALAIGVHYVAADPFEYDMTQLRSAGAEAREARTWMGKSDAAFGRGIAGQTFIAADDAREVPAIVGALGALPKDTVGKVRSILDAVPADQPKKIAALAAIRALLDDTALDAMSDDERAEALELRPPAGIAPVTADDLPASVRESLRERDGRLGLLVGVRPAAQLDEWNGKDLVRFATAVRRLELPDHRIVTTSGASVIFADILAAIRHDGLRVTGLAVAGLVAMVLLVVGRDRRAVAVIAAIVAGALGLVATCALLGLRVNFLDFVALPITLGLGVDYAINMAHRRDEPIATMLRTAGGAVFVCSLTTIIGYGSLLVSDNLAIRGFGVASLIGEVATLAAALIIVPAMVSRRSPAA